MVDLSIMLKIVIARHKLQLSHPPPLSVEIMSIKVKNLSISILCVMKIKFEIFHPNILLKIKSTVPVDQYSAPDK